MDAACVVVNLFMLPDEPGLFRQCVQNISRLGNDCEKYGMPLMIEPLVMQPNEKGGYLVDGDTEKMVTLVQAGARDGRRHHQGRPDRPIQRLPPCRAGGALPGAGARRRQGRSARGVRELGGADGRRARTAWSMAATSTSTTTRRAVVAALMAMIHDGADADAPGDLRKRRQEVSAFLGIDAGNTGVKAVLFDDGGRALASAHRDTGGHARRPAWSSATSAGCGADLDGLVASCLEKSRR